MSVTGEKVEIERKFRLFSLPEGLNNGDVATAVIEQGYIGKLRLRRQGNQFFLNVKGRKEQSLGRDEWEVEVPGWVFAKLWPQTEGARLTKTRYGLRRDGRLLEIDIFQGHLAGLILLECEFASEAEAISFCLPEIFRAATEVTDDERYKNSQLARSSGIPQ